MHELIASKIVCPLCRGELATSPAALSCAACRRTYPVRDEVGNFLGGTENLHDGFGHDLNQAKERGNVFEKVFHGNRVRTVQRWLKEGGCLGGELLELGCNTGPVLIPLLQEDVRIVGLDVIASDIETCRKTLQERRLRADGLLVADGKRTPFRDASFDGVLLVDVLEHTTDPEGIVAEVRRILRPGGFTYVSVPWKWHPVVRHDWIRKMLTRRETVDEHPDIPFDNATLDRLFAGWTLERRGLVYQWVCIGALYRRA